MKLKAWVYQKSKNIIKSSSVDIEYFYRHHLDTIPAIQPRIPISFEILKPGEVQRLHEVWPVSATRMNKRLANGDKCFVGLFDGAAVSYHWLQTTGTHNLAPSGRSINIDQGSGWVYHVRVKDEFQGKRINTFMYTKILEHCAEKGLEKVWIYTARWNRANQRSIQKVGYTYAGRTIRIRFLGQTVFRSGIGFIDE